MAPETTAGSLRVRALSLKRSPSHLRLVDLLFGPMSSDSVCNVVRFLQTLAPITSNRNRYGDERAINL
jgi:hypothetical protein